MREERGPRQCKGNRQAQRSQDFQWIQKYLNICIANVAILMHPAENPAFGGGKRYEMHNMAT